MEYFIHIIILVSIFSILGLSLNLVVGETGLLSVTQAAFYGIGAYATAILSVDAGMNLFLATICSIVLTGLVALGIGVVLSRLKGDYYTLGSFGFNIIISSIFLNWQEVTHGQLGVAGIPRPEIFGFHFLDSFSFLFLALAVLALVYCVCWFITKSSFGRVLRSIREDEDVMSVFGYRTTNYKLVIFVISAMLAAVAGAVFASYISFIDPSNFTLNESIFVLAIIIMGGLSSHRGAIVGALFLIILPEVLRFVGLSLDAASFVRQLAYGLILVLLMLYRPQGFLGKFRL
ncbi:MAG: branched-chain amino acid ABC transporter permease [bacterium]